MSVALKKFLGVVEYGLDNYQEVGARTEEKVIDFLASREEATTRLEVKARDIKVIPLNLLIKEISRKAINERDYENLSQTLKLVKKEALNQLIKANHQVGMNYLLKDSLKKNGDTTRESIKGLNLGLHWEDKVNLVADVYMGQLENLLHDLPNFKEVEAAYLPMLYKDTLRNTGTVLCIEGEYYLMGESAWLSVSQRASLYGSGFSQLPAALKAKVLNNCFKRDGDRVYKVIIVEGKVRAMMSQYYSIIEASKVFGSVFEKAKERFGSFEVCDFYCDHYSSHVKILLNDSKVQQELNQLYNIRDEFIPGLFIETSDTGHSAIKVSVFWQSKRRKSHRISHFISNSIYIAHKGGKELDNLLIELPTLFTQYHDNMARLADLMLTPVDHPVLVLEEACEKLDLGKKLSRNIVEDFELSIGPNSTAYDVCSAILQAGSMVDTSISRQLDIEAKLGKALHLDYEKMDKVN